MDFLQNSQTTLRLGGVLVAFSLTLALVSQYFFDLAPCDLCVVQRYPAFVAVGIMFLAELVKNPRLMLAFFMIACLVTMNIAFYHTGIEQKWWPGPSSCSGQGDSLAGLSLEDVRAQIMATPLVRCDKPALEVMGLTMASANMLFSLGLVVMSFMALRKSRPIETGDNHG